MADTTDVPTEPITKEEERILTGLPDEDIREEGDTEDSATPVEGKASMPEAESVDPTRETVSDKEVKVTAFRDKYRPLTALETKHIADVKKKANELFDLILLENTEMSVARIKLQEVVMWAVKGITK